MEKELIEAIRGLTERFAQRRYPVYEANDVLDNEETCKVLHCSLRALDTYVSKNGLPCHKAGVKRLFFYGEIITWLKYEKGKNIGDCGSEKPNRKARTKKPA